MRVVQGHLFLKLCGQNLTTKGKICFTMKRLSKMQAFEAVAYPGIFFGGGVQQIQLRTDRMGIWGW